MFPGHRHRRRFTRFQLHLVEQGVSCSSLNAAVTALQFFFGVTLGRPDVMTKMSHVHEPRKLPVILSPEKVTRLLEVAPGLKYQAALSVEYGAGLCASEVVGLKVDDIDSQRMSIRVEEGKGHKDNYAMLSPTLLQLLRAWWKEAHGRGKILPHGWLFPGQNPINPLTTRQLNRVCQRCPGSLDRQTDLTAYATPLCLVSDYVE
jgi:site-specific recombinase XerD